MPSEAMQRVVNKLNDLHGNIEATAEALQVSPSWVARIKKKHWRPTSDRALAVQPGGHIIPQPLRTNKVRELTLQRLTERLEGDTEIMETPDLIKLLKVVLDYDRAMTTAQPTFGRGSVQINQQFNVDLVDKLAQLPVDALRALSSDDVIEGDYE